MRLLHGLVTVPGLVHVVVVGALQSRVVLSLVGQLQWRDDDAIPNAHFADQILLLVDAKNDFVAAVKQDAEQSLTRHAEIVLLLESQRCVDTNGNVLARI